VWTREIPFGVGRVLGARVRDDRLSSAVQLRRIVLGYDLLPAGQGAQALEGGLILGALEKQGLFLFWRQGLALSGAVDAVTIGIVSWSEDCLNLI
jgi:hypothetical protein